MKRGLATGVGRIVGREKQVKLQVVDIYRLSAKQWRRLSPPCTMGTPATRRECGRGQRRAHPTQIPTLIFAKLAYLKACWLV